MVLPALSLGCCVQGHAALDVAAGNVHSMLAATGMSMALTLTGVPSVKLVAELIRCGARVKAANDEVCSFHHGVVKPPVSMTDAAQDEHVCVRAHSIRYWCHFSVALCETKGSGHKIGAIAITHSDINVDVGQQQSWQDTLLITTAWCAGACTW